MGEDGADVRAEGSRYQTTLDRAGLALAAGGGLYGALAMLLGARSGTASVPMLIAVLAAGTVLAMLAITATLGPLWLALHASGRRGPVHAALLGAVVALTLWTAAAHHMLASYAFADRASAAIGWVRAIGVALMFMAAGAAITLVMWRIAYRRVG